MSLHQLYPDPEGEGDHNAAVDIIAVHGLNPRSKDDEAHAWGTWQSPGGKLWLRDELPKELPDTRIFLYEYNSTAVYGADRSTFIDKVNAFLEIVRVKRRKTPRRPLLLLGHSLGGLLIKQALVNAHNNEKYLDIKLATQGLGFFATPHKGGSQTLVNIGQIAAKVALALGFQKGDNILEALDNGSMFSDLMNEHWKHRLLEYPIVSFWGTLDSIVPKESTTFGLPGIYEALVPLKADHGGVCRFGDGKDDKGNLELVMGNILDLYDKAIENAHKLPQKDSVRSKRVTDLLKKLYKSSYNDGKNRNPRRVKGTCAWFTGHQRFKQWRDNKSGLLWVSADPGCGKSVLSRHLADYVLPSTPSRISCYFFFKDNLKDQNRADAALCCLLRQIFMQKPELISDNRLQRFEQDDDRLLGSVRGLWDMLVSVARDSSAVQIVCILDALDECEDDGKRLLLEMLSDFYLGDSGKGSLKFLVTSRPYVHIGRALHNLETRTPTIHLRGEDQTEVDKIAKEIDLVIGARVAEVAEKLELTKAEEQELRNEIEAKPNRTYLWVYLIFEAVENWVDRSQGRIREQMKNIPATVDEAYEKILSRCPDVERARKLLHIVVAATTPLTLAEMAVAMAIDDCHTSSSQLEIEPAKRLHVTIRELCGLFVSIIGDKVFLLHQTAVEFLVKRSMVDSSSSNSPLTNDRPCSKWRRSLSPSSSNRILGSICAQFLLFTDVETRFESRLLRATPSGFKNNGLNSATSQSSASLQPLSRGCKDDEAGYAFLNYAWKNWAVHLGKAGSDDETLLRRMLQLCDANRSACLLRFRSALSQPFLRPEHLPQLVVASYLGLAAVTRYLLKLEVTDANAREGAYGCTALSWAVAKGHTAVIQTFIDADQRYQETRGVISGLFGGYLVNFNAETKGREEVYDTGRSGLLNDPSIAILEAAYETFLEAERYYQQTTASVRRLAGMSYAYFDANMLRWDERSPRWRTTEIKSPSTPLDWAVHCGNQEIVKQLLATGRVIVSKETLFSAAMRDLVEIFEALLRTRQVEPDCRASNGRSLLNWAIVHRSVRVLEYLLNTGRFDVEMEINSTVQRDMSGVAYAAVTEADQLLPQLLATGKARVDESNRWDRTVLYYAAINGNEEWTRLLLAESRASVDKRDYLGRSPLSEAAMNGHVEVVRLLLATGEVDVNSRDRRRRTPLCYAAEKGREGVVQQLLDMDGIDVHAKDRDGYTALALARSARSEVCTKHLLAAMERLVPTSMKTTGEPL